MKTVSGGIMTLVGLTSLLGASLQMEAQSDTKKPIHTKSAKSMSAVTYKAHCGMVYSATDAKKYHYICPMDHKPLVKMTSTNKSGHTGKMKMGK